MRARRLKINKRGSRRHYPLKTTSFYTNGSNEYDGTGVYINIKITNEDELQFRFTDAEVKGLISCLQLHLKISGML